MDINRRRPNIALEKLGQVIDDTSRIRRAIKEGLKTREQLTDRETQLVANEINSVISVLTEARLYVEGKQ